VLGIGVVALGRPPEIGNLRGVDGLGYGLGFETVERYGAEGMAAPGNYGWGGAYGSLYRIDPQSNLTIVMMLQLMPNQTDFREKLQNLIYQAVAEPVQLHE